MKWQAAFAGAFASALVIYVALVNVAFASADLRIVNDPGGEVSSYIRKFQTVAASGQHVVIDGPCLSACTLLTAFVPKDHVCITNRAVLGFHAASYYDDTSRSLVPTREGTRLVMRLYPAEIKNWIQRHGGLTPRLMTLRGRELAGLYSACH